MGRIARVVKRIILLLWVIWLAPTVSLAETHLPKSMRIFPEVQGYWFLDGELLFGCEVTYTNGGKRRTTGYLNGNLLWKELVCESDQATCEGDKIFVDLFKVRQNNNTLLIRVHMLGFSLIKTEFELKVPPLQDIEVLLPENTKPRYGDEIEPYVRLQWVNGASYTYLASDVKALVPRDSVTLYYNNEIVHNGIISLPAFNLEEPHSFSLSVVWTSKPWLNHTEVYSYYGREHQVWKFRAENGADARDQLAAPKGMDGAEGFYGMPGADAADIQVNLFWNEDKTKLIVQAVNGRDAYRGMFSPAEFSLEIIARGGRGGDGGRGGEGGAAPVDDPYHAGVGGKGGRGAQGGKGAAVSIESAPGTEAFVPCIIIDNQDGEPGRPGKGGRGGVFSMGYGTPTLLELLFPSRNYDGEPGDE
jgi:hypothetical protein